VSVVLKICASLFKSVLSHYKVNVTKALINEAAVDTDTAGTLVVVE